MSDRHERTKPNEETALPEGFVWDAPGWIRTDRFHASPAKFLFRVIGGGLIGLLLGRVVGSLEGIFLQWGYGGMETAVGPALEKTLGAALYWLALVVGKVLSPFFFASPLQDTLHAVETQKTGTVALLLLAQLHGSLNGLHQGIRPALGNKLLAIVERVILPWGLLWRTLTYPVWRVFFRPPRREEIKALLADSGDGVTRRRLVSLARRGLLPGIESGSAFWTERETIAHYPGKQPTDAREKLWWKTPAFRREVYGWIEQQRSVKALPLLIRGLHDPDPNARESAVRALVSLKHVETIRYLALALDDDETVTKVAEEGLRALAASM